MSAEMSPGAHKRYGLQRVGDVLEFPRSTAYAKRLAGVRVARKRIRRLMRGNRLLSPHRLPKGLPDPHAGTIITTAADVMWGTDGIRSETVEDGRVRVFSAVDHFNAEWVVWHAVRIGSRFAALEPIAQGLTRRFGSTSASAARGLSPRFDHGARYMADQFLNRLGFRGIAQSPVFVAEPQTSGAAERFNRTLKEQAIHGRVFRRIGNPMGSVPIEAEGCACDGGLSTGLIGQ